MKFTQFDKATGRIINSGTTDNLDGMVSGTTDVLSGVEHYDGYVMNGAHFEYPPQPSPHHAFNYTARQWEDPRTTETEWAVVRSKRARLLLSCDWTQLPDVPPTTQGAWASYRQALRDITQQADPFNIVWPAAPGTL